jgi:hypothetical protein
MSRPAYPDRNLFRRHGESGKGDKPRPTDRKKFEESPYWASTTFYKKQQQESATRGDQHGKV